MRAAKLAIAFAIVLALLTWAAVPLIKRWMAPAAPNWITGVPPAQHQAGQILDLPSECTLRSLPAEFEYDAVGVYQGAKTDAQQNSRFQGLGFVGAINVKVTATARPVVLFLSSYSAAVWTIEAAPGAEIAGIAFSGYYPALVRGDLPSSAKVIDLTADSHCGDRHAAYAYNGDGFRALQTLAIAVVGAKLSTVQGEYDNGSFIVGPGAQHISDLAAIRAKVRKLSTSGPENAKLDALIRDGAIRPATGDELFAWESADPELSAYGLVRRPRAMIGPYMILKSFTYPPGMHGAGSATFILPKGMPMPFGDPGHNSVLLMEPWNGCIELMAGGMCTQQQP
jgi:hypothetical protein